MEDFDSFISNKLNMTKNYDKFQGSLKKKNYFEGYYYKINKSNTVVSIIVGVSLSNDPHSFIQIMENSKNSVYLRYNLKDFYYDKNKFLVKIQDNVFTDKLIAINIDKDNYKIKANLELENMITNNKNIMGPFRFLPFMECKHHIISYKSNTVGYMHLNDSKYEFDNDITYIEKDYGTSFPLNYTWIQGYNENKDATLVLAVARIPYLKIRFRGVISSVVVNNKKYNISTYNGSKILKNTQNEIVIKNRKYKLEISILEFEGSTLIAPVLGKMTKEIKESNTGKIFVKLSSKKEVILNDTFDNCGIEFVS